MVTLCVSPYSVWTVVLTSHMTRKQTFLPRHPPPLHGNTEDVTAAGRAQDRASEGTCSAHADQAPVFRGSLRHGGSSHKQNRQNSAPRTLREQVSDVFSWQQGAGVGDRGGAGPRPQES